MTRSPDGRNLGKKSKGMYIYFMFQVLGTLNLLPTSLQKFGLASAALKSLL